MINRAQAARPGVFEKDVTVNGASAVESARQAIALKTPGVRGHSIFDRQK
jgi:hypothetical protein